MSFESVTRPVWWKAKQKIFGSLLTRTRIEKMTNLIFHRNISRFDVLNRMVQRRGLRMKKVLYNLCTLKYVGVFSASDLFAIFFLIRLGHINVRT